MKRSIPLLLLTALCVAGGSAAQSHRWTDPKTGRTVFSNQAPPSNVKPQKNAEVADTVNPESELPFALREPVRSFPVTLFTAGNCKEICDNARKLLQSRGTPHTEREVDSQAVLNELRQVSGAETIPTLMVGGQAARGYDARAWTNLLDLAGYPQTPTAGYKPPARAATEAKAPAQ